MLRKALKLESGNAAAHYNLGIAYLRSGDVAAANEEYEALEWLSDDIAEALKAVLGRKPRKKATKKPQKKPAKKKAAPRKKRR